jgi:hypothetical protein
MGHLAFPFIDQGKDLGYTGERERKRKRRKRGREPWSYATLSSAGMSYWSCRRQRRRGHVATFFITGAIGRCHRLGHSAPIRHWATGTRRLSATASHLTLVCGMVNRSPCLELRGDRAAQWQSTRRCWRRECLDIAYGSHRSHQDVSAPFLALGAWS